VGRSARHTISSTCLLAVSAILFGFLIISPVSTSAQSQEVKTVRDLMRYCTSDDKTQRLYCDGFLMGVRQAMMDKSKPGLCLIDPHNALTVRDVREALGTWAMNNPDRLNEPAVVGATDALARAAPCF